MARTLNRRSQAYFLGFLGLLPGYMPSGYGWRKATMSTLGRVRETSVQVAKVQRRIWLIQTVFWPVIGIIGVVLAVVTARSAWRRWGTSTHVAPAAPQEPVGLNGVVTGN